MLNNYKTVSIYWSNAHHTLNLFDFLVEMEKLIRVSNTFRGKKLILSPGDYDDFLSKGE